METAKKTTRKSGGKNAGEKLAASYIAFVLNNGNRPPSVYKFCLDLGIPEEEFYKHAGSFPGLEKNIWQGFIERVINSLQRDNNFMGFTVREKFPDSNLAGSSSSSARPVWWW